MNPAPEARAGAFAVTSCSERANYDTHAYRAAQSSRRMLIKRACNAFTRGRTGLITANQQRRGRVRRGEHASLVLHAPPGTVLTSIRWSGQGSRGDCGFAVEMFGDGPRQSARFLAKLPAARRCRLHNVSSAGRPSPRTYSLGRSTRIVQRVVCRDRGGCSTSRLTALRTYLSRVTVADVSRPGVRITGGRLIGRWVRGSADLRFTAGDNVGVSRETLVVSGGRRADRERPCNPARTVPCPSGPGLLTLNTLELADGAHNSRLEIRDSAGNLSSVGFRAYVDNNPPGRVGVSLDGGQAWRRTNTFSARWANPPDRHAPIAGAFYRLCRTAAPSDCRTASRPGGYLAALGGLRVPGPGDWSLALWRYDSAGNASSALASVPVHLRFDPDPPAPAFERPTLADPTRLSVVVGDRTSGLAGGEIELRRRGSSVWQSLTTRREGTRLVTRIDDSRLPRGEYDLRSRAVDQAGNEATTQRRTDGSPATLTLPLRFQSVLTGGIERSKMVRRVVRRRGKRRRVRRRVVRLLPGARVAYGRQARLSGRLTNVDGQPIFNATLYVFSRTPGEGESLAGAVNTDANGRYRYIARASQNRNLRLLYQGTSLVLPSQREVNLVVPAATSLRVNRRRARNGGSVVFRGRVNSQPLPATGKLIEMQAFFRGRWRTFSTVRSDSRGRWRFRYRFGGTAGRVRYRFRAVLPAEGGYPFAGGRSRVVGVTVRGS